MVIGALKPFQGTIYQTTLSTEAVDALHEVRDWRYMKEEVGEINFRYKITSEGLVIRLEKGEKVLIYDVTVEKVCIKFGDKYHIFECYESSAAPFFQWFDEEPMTMEMVVSMTNGWLEALEEGD